MNIEVLIAYIDPSSISLIITSITIPLESTCHQPKTPNQPCDLVYTKTNVSLLLSDLEVCQAQGVPLRDPVSNPSRRVALLYCVPVLRVGIQVLLPAQEHAGERDRLTLLLGLRLVKASYRDNVINSNQITTFLGHF